MKVARASGQLQLLTIPPILNAANNAQARNAYGSAVQEIVCAAMDLFPIKTDGRFDLCFDAERAGIFYEIKSVHRFGKLPLYDFRLKKEIESGEKSFYAILVHNLRGAREDIYRRMVESAICIHVIPTEFVAAVAMEFPLRVPVPKQYAFRAGFCRGGYGRGYRNVSVKTLVTRYYQSPG